jgi:hypothetical protein
MKYPKINTLWKRNEKGIIIEGNYSCPEFSNIKLWQVSEKIHGVNIRVEFDVFIKNGKVDIFNIKFFGKTDNAEIHPNLIKYLKETFTTERLSKMIIIKTKQTGNPKDESFSVTLYGEGVGPKIQKGGGRYRKDVVFILFDVMVGKWWLEGEDVYDVSQKLSIDCAPTLGLMNEEDIINLVKEGFKSNISEDKELDAEGIVARSFPIMLFKNGKPIYWKLKQNDFKEVKNVFPFTK